MSGICGQQTSSFTIDELVRVEECPPCDGFLSAFSDKAARPASRWVKWTKSEAVGSRTRGSSFILTLKKNLFS